MRGAIKGVFREGFYTFLEIVMTVLLAFIATGAALTILYLGIVAAIYMVRLIAAVGSLIF